MTTDPTPDTTLDTTRQRLYALAAATMAVLVYLNALKNPFIYDDYVTVFNERQWLTPRAMIHLSYTIDNALFQMRPFGYHVTNLCLHVLNVLLFFRLATRLRLEMRLAFFAAALFAVHPLMTETVGYVAARAGLLCATFALCSLHALRRGLDHKRRRWVALALFFYACALLTKESAAVLPFVFLAWDRGLSEATPEERRRRLRRVHLPLVGLTLLAGAARLVIHARLEGGTVRPDWLHLLGQCVVCWRYLALLCAPLSQSIFHPVQHVASVADPLGWLALAGLVAGVYALFRAPPLVRFGGLWFLLFLAPSSLVPLQEAMAEHRVYEASMGFFLVAAVGLGRLPRRAAPILGGLLLVALSAATVARNRVWASPVALWQEAAAHAPEHWGPHYALGDAYRESGDCAHAVIEYRNAVELAPNQPRPSINLGICLAELERIDEAEAAFQAALKLTPTDATIYNDLGVIALGRGRREAAQALFRRALELDPRYSKAQENLAASFK